MSGFHGEPPEAQRLGPVVWRRVWAGTLMETDLGISHMRDKSLKHTWGLELLDPCQPHYLEHPPFPAKTTLNASSRKRL